MISLLLIDDHPIVMQGLSMLIDGESDINVAGVANDLSEARRLIAERRPDVVVSDVQLGGESGLDLLADYTDGRPAILLLSSFDYPAYHARAVHAGAVGFVSKGAPMSELLTAIRDAAAGRPAFTTAALRAVRELLPPPSEREIEVISEIAAGKSNDQTARRLSISVKTVESHLRRLFTRYGVFSRTELAMKARDEGWLDAHVRGA